MVATSLAKALLLGLGLLSTAVECRSSFRDKVDARLARFKGAARETLDAKAKEQASYRYSNGQTQKYAVKSLPDVNYNIGELYSGLTPINSSDTSRGLFWMFKPRIGAPVNEITVWLNGGPGCSSLAGFFQENGPFVWQPGTAAPAPNPYSWANLTNMLWVEQPVGTGFSIGKVTATTEEEIAEDFVNFFRNWQKIFGIKNYKIYVTGESYAGRYVPYISAAMLNQKDKTNFDLSGALVYDPCIGEFDYTQEQVPAVPFVQANENLFNFNSTLLSQLSSLHESCGYREYIDKYLQFPPPGMQPAINESRDITDRCDVFDIINTEALDVNPCFDIYEINQMCPILSDVMSFPTELFDQNAGQPYFNRTDVKQAIHAPMSVDWAICANDPVFIGKPVVHGYPSGGPEREGDFSADPIQKVLPQVIEATNRVLVSNGDYDMIILTNGTLMAIQNMTWNGHLGFQTRPSTPINVRLPDLQYQDLYAANGAKGIDGPQGIMGIQHFERGLMWAQSYQSGHMQPEFQPRLTYRHMQWLLGRIQQL